jgi:Flp pilus assembly secretin CpaC
LNGFTNAILFAFGLLFGTGLSATAQDAGGVVPPCRTTAGPEGRLFVDTYAMVHSPVPFATATAVDGAVTLVPEVRDASGMLLMGGLPRFSPEYGTGAAVDEIVFQDEAGQTVHQCRVELIAFDPAVHKLADLQSGDCNLRLLAGLPRLLAGHAQVWETPSDFSELLVDNPAIGDISTLSERRLYLLGKSPGIVVLVWIGGEPGAFTSINFCPFEVLGSGDALAAQAIGENDLCRDDAGQPMRLKVGQTARLHLNDPAGSPLEVWEASIAAPRIADFRFLGSAREATVTGSAPGSTSVTLFGAGGTPVLACEIVVE